MNNELRHSDIVLSEIGHLTLNECFEHSRAREIAANLSTRAAGAAGAAGAQISAAITRARTAVNSLLNNINKRRRELTSDLSAVANSINAALRIPIENAADRRELEALQAQLRTLQTNFDALNRRIDQTSAAIRGLEGSGDSNAERALQQAQGSLQQAWNEYAPLKTEIVRLRNQANQVTTRIKQRGRR